eukprot:616657-Alexandrium_andersonii.AAC.1
MQLVFRGGFVVEARVRVELCGAEVLSILEAAPAGASLPRRTDDLPNTRHAPMLARPRNRCNTQPV